MLPDADGLDLCRRLRGSTDVPILMLTARGEPMDRVVGLEVGADDYLAKPFEPRELQARLRAILRRKGGAARGPRCCASAGSRSTRARARCGSTARSGSLTGYQFTLLLTLAERAGRVLSRDALMDLLKGEKLEAFDRSVDVHISPHPRRHRGRSQEAPAHPDGARHGLRLRQGPGPMSAPHPAALDARQLTCSASTSSSTSPSCWCWRCSSARRRCVWKLAEDASTPQYLDVAAELTGALLPDADAPQAEQQKALDALHRKLRFDLALYRPRRHA